MKMPFRFMFLVLLLLTFSGHVQAAGNTYYVSLSGDNGNNGLSEGTAWRHIAYATQQVQAGDTLIIKSGDYGNERATITNSGTADAPIVIKAEYPGKVILTGNGSGTGISIVDRHHIIIEGIKFTNYSSGIGIGDPASYITIRKCIFVENTSAGLIVWGHSGGNVSITHHFEFAENQFYDYTDKQDYAISLNYGMYAWVHNNYFFGEHHQALSFKRKFWYGLAENNIFEGFLYSALYLGQNLNKESEDNRSRYLVAQGNVFRPARGFRAKTCIWVANVEYAVVRNNFMEGLESVDGGWGQGIALGDGESGYTPANPTHVTIYRNVMRRISGTTTNPGIRVMHDCTDVRVFNNTFATCAHGLGFEVYETVHFKNNIFYDNQHGMIRGSDAADARNCTFEYNNTYPDWSGKGATDTSVEPLFVGPFGPVTLEDENPTFVPDFTRAEVCRLQAGSPCIDNGAHLTYAAGSGNGDKITVHDAGYFTDGFDIATGDLIKVGANALAGILEIDYDNNIITLDQSISWNNGDKVNLAYSGSAPDQGAYEYGDAIPPEITLKKIKVNGSVDDATVTNIDINGVSVPVVSGAYSHEVDVTSTNTITIIAVNGDGKTVTRTIEVK